MKSQKYAPRSQLINNQRVKRTGAGLMACLFLVVIVAFLSTSLPLRMVEERTPPSPSPSRPTPPPIKKLQLPAVDSSSSFPKKMHTKIRASAGFKQIHSVEEKAFFPDKANTAHPGYATVWKMVEQQQEDTPTPVPTSIETPAPLPVVEATQIADFCSKEWALKHDVYTAHPPLDINLPSKAAVEAVLPERTSRVWQLITAEGYLEPNNLSSPQSSTDLHPNIRKAAEATTRLFKNPNLSCPQNLSAVVAFGVYPMHLLVPFIKSFQKHAAGGGCNVLHLFVEGGIIDPLSVDGYDPLVGTLPGNIIIEDYTAWAELAAAGPLGGWTKNANNNPPMTSTKYDDIHRETDPYTNRKRHRVEAKRVAILYHWIQHQLGLQHRYQLLLHLDTRDVLFEGGDPFSFLRDSAAIKAAVEKENRSDWLFVVAEDAEFGYNQFGTINKHWVEGVSNAAFADLAMKEVLLQHQGDQESEARAAMRILNAGFYGGTMNALRDLEWLLGKTLQLAPPKGFGYDQGALQALYFAGFRLAAFPHTALILNPATTPYRHMYPFHGGNAHIKWGLHHQQYNCLGEPYQVIHHLDRFVAEWEHTTTEYINTKEDECSRRTHLGRQGQVVGTENTTKRALFTPWRLTATPTRTAAARQLLDRAEGDDISVFSRVTERPLRNGTKQRCSSGETVAILVRPSVVVGMQEAPTLRPLVGAEVQPLILSFQEVADANCHSLHLVGEEPRQLVLDRRHNAPKVFFHTGDQWDPQTDESNKGRRAEMIVLGILQRLATHLLLSGGPSNKILLLPSHKMLFKPRGSGDTLFDWMHDSKMKAGGHHIFALSSDAPLLPGHPLLKKLFATLSALHTKSIDVVASEKLLFDALLGNPVANRSDGVVEVHAPSFLSSSTIIGGTTAGVADFFTLLTFLETRLQMVRVVKSGDAVDPPLSIMFTLAFYLGLDAYGFPHTAWLLDDLRGPMRTSFEAHQDLMATGRVHLIQGDALIDVKSNTKKIALRPEGADRIWLDNCRGEGYDILGGFTDDALWQRMAKRLQHKWWAAHKA